VSLAQAQELVQQVSASVVLIRERSELVEQGRMKSAGTRRKRGKPARMVGWYWVWGWPPSRCVCVHLRLEDRRVFHPGRPPLARGSVGIAGAT